MNKINPRLRIFIFNYSKTSAQLMTLDMKRPESDIIT